MNSYNTIFNMKIFNNNYICFDENTYYDVKTNILSLEKIKMNNINRNYMYTSLKNNIIISRKEILASNKCITLLNILPAMECEGNCLYCYNEDSNHKESSFLTIEHIKNNLNYLKQQNIQIKLQMVRFYGGEPFLNKELLNIILYLNSLFNITFYISTGLLFSDSHFQNIVIPTCKTLLQNNINFFIGVTVDFGSFPYTRKNRYNLNSDALIYRCRLLEQLGVSVKYSNIVTKYTNVNLLFEKILYHYHNSKNIKDEHLRYHITAVNHPILYPTKKQLLFIYKKIKKLYKTNKKWLSIFSMRNSIDGSFQIYQIDETKYLFIFPNMYCGIYSNMVSINSKGELINCQMEPEIKYNTPNLQDLQLLLNNDKCLNCNFFLMCRSGCIKRIQYTQNIEAQNITCYWTKLNHILSLFSMYYKCDGFNNNFIKQFKYNKIQNFIF